MAIAVLVAVAAAGCGGVGPGAGGSPAAGAAGEVGGTITVFAASSLSTAFRAEAAAFTARHPRADVQQSFGGSAALATQIDQGAPADVFASADSPNMQKVVEAGNAAAPPRAFATNRLQVVVPAGNPKHVSSLADLAAPGLVVVLCAPAVPCGNYAGQALARAGVKVTPASQEQDVSAVVTKVALGEADAGIVYVTDVMAAGAKVTGVEIPDSQNVIATYPVATLKGGANPAGGQAFVDFVLSEPGQAILARYGFSKP